MWALNNTSWCQVVCKRYGKVPMQTENWMTASILTVSLPHRWWIPCFLSKLCMYFYKTTCGLAKSEKKNVECLLSSVHTCGIQTAIYIATLIMKLDKYTAEAGWNQLPWPALWHTVFSALFSFPEIILEVLWPSRELKLQFAGNCQK